MRDRHTCGVRAGNYHHNDDHHEHGYLTEYTPGSAFVIKETSGPVSYRYGEKMTYTTRSGQALTDEQIKTRIKVGAPVNVHYSTEGEDRIINRVEIDDIEIDDD